MNILYIRFIFLWSLKLLDTWRCNLVCKMYFNLNFSIWTIASQSNIWTTFPLKSFNSQKVWKLSMVLQGDYELFYQSNINIFVKSSSRSRNLYRVEKFSMKNVRNLFSNNTVKRPLKSLPSGGYGILKERKGYIAIT